MLTRDLEAKRNVKVCIFFVFLLQENIIMFILNKNNK